MKNKKSSLQYIFFGMRWKPLLVFELEYLLRHGLNGSGSFFFLFVFVFWLLSFVYVFVCLFFSFKMLSTGIHFGPRDIWKSSRE